MLIFIHINAFTDLRPYSTSVNGTGVSTAITSRRLFPLDFQSGYVAKCSLVVENTGAPVGDHNEEHYRAF